MLSRGFGFCSILVAASVARGGATVQFARTPLACSPNAPNGTYVVNQEVSVEVQLAQNAGGSDQRLRMVEFDLQQTSSLLGIALPTTHNLGTPGPGDDVQFWLFSSLSECVSTPSFCGFNHYLDSSLAAGPVDTRPNILSAAYHSTTANASAQFLLSSDGTPLTVGRMTVTMPSFAGDFSLNVLNGADADAVNRRARLDYSFDPHITWRAGGVAPNDLVGGTFTFHVVDQCTGCTPDAEVTRWESVRTHGAFGPIGLEIANTGLFSEPRGGLSKIVVTFSRAINPATATPANVIVCGNDVNGSPVNLAAVTITTAVINSDTQMEINFATRLPDYARYRVALSGVQCAGGGAVVAGVGGLSRILTALQGDAVLSRHINSQDVGGARSLLNVSPFNPANINHVRSDANNSGSINSQDVGGIRSFLNRDARNILDPVCP